MKMLGGGFSYRLVDLLWRVCLGSSLIYRVASRKPRGGEDPVSALVVGHGRYRGRFLHRLGVLAAWALS